MSFPPTSSSPQTSSAQYYCQGYPNNNNTGIKRDLIYPCTRAPLTDDIDRTAFFSLSSTSLWLRSSMIRHSTSPPQQACTVLLACSFTAVSSLAAWHVPFKQMLFMHWAPTPIDPQDSDVQYIILACAVWYAAALGPLGHCTLTSIALLYLHHPVVALAKMKQFKSDYDLQYSTDLEAGC
jgi:hypothetical protein